MFPCARVMTRPESGCLQPLHFGRVELAAASREDRAGTQHGHVEHDPAAANVLWLDLVHVHAGLRDVPLLPLTILRVQPSNPGRLEHQHVPFGFHGLQRTPVGHVILHGLDVPSDQVFPLEYVLPRQSWHTSSLSGQ